jgi:quercetin dioxygenase-like cupin family protein
MILVPASGSHPYCERTAADQAKENIMQITRNPLETNTGPSDWFTGTVYIDPVATPSPPSRIQAVSVHFTPGARTVWHTHPYGQTIYVTEGIGRCQRRGGPVETIAPGDSVHFEPGEDHWHGAAPDRLMNHIAIQELDDAGSPATWGEHVTDEEYHAAPAKRSIPSGA